MYRVWLLLEDVTSLWRASILSRLQQIVEQLGLGLSF